LRIHFVRRARLAVLWFASTWLAASPTNADVISLGLNPTSVYGTDNSTGTVTLTSVLGGRTRTVDLSSNNPAVASVPASVETDFRAPNVATFTITTYPVAVQTNVTITATEDGVSKQAVITVNPPILTSITFSPDPVRGGTNSLATITTNRPAKSNWLCSIQGPYPPIYFMTGSIVSFTQGSTMTTKTINTVAVNTSVDTLITVRPPTGQTPNVSAYLEVVPLRAESLSLAPFGVTGGAASLGCVTLNGPAPAGGVLVALESSDPSVASVPATLPIASADEDGCFIVQSHAVDGCTSAVISATFGGQTKEATLDVGVTDLITDNAANDRWGPRHSTTVDGKVLWTDGNDVFFDNGASTQLVQARGALQAVDPLVFGLGSGTGTDQVIGAWRRGTDAAWVWQSGGGAVLVSAVNPIDPQQAMNPEAVAIADGSVFIAFQAFFNANAVRHVFGVDPTSGATTNLTGDLAVPGASRITTSGGEAAWLFVDSANPKLHYYDGVSVTEIDSGEINEVSLRLSRGRLVYEKIVGGVSHVFLFDSTLEGPGPVRISPDTDAAHGHFAPVTDGYHIAWLYGDADRTDLDVLLYGGLQLSGAASRPANQSIGQEFPLQLQRGQLLWKDTEADLRYAAGGTIEALCLTPGDSFTSPWLSDGLVAWYGRTQDLPAGDNEIFLYPGVDPQTDEPLPPIVLVPTPGDEHVVLEWDTILGASSYDVYFAHEPGVTPENFGSLAGGAHWEDISMPSTRVCGLTNGVAYYFVVTATESDDEGGLSVEATATPNTGSAPTLGDAAALLDCLSGPGVSAPPAGCRPVAASRADLTCDRDVDLADFAAFSNLLEP